MKSRNDIQQELKELGSSLSIESKTPVFSVPNGYFENFAASVLDKIKQVQNDSATNELESLSPLLARISKKMPFEVPNQYFTNMGNEAPLLVQDDYLPQVLQQAGKQHPYTVPQGYFDAFAGQMLQQVKNQPAQQAKVVSMQPARATASIGWLRAIAAAAVIGIIGVSVFFFSQKTTPIDPSKNSEAWVEKKLKNISTEELESFIEITAATAPNKEMAQNSAGRQDVRKLLKDVSTSELDAFLSEVPNNNDEIMLN